MDSLHEINIQANSKKVFDAWTSEKGLSSWWTAKSQNIENVYVFTFDEGNVEFHFRVDNQTPGKHLTWTGIKAPKMPDEWVETKIVVDLEESEGSTRMKFGHKNWKSTEGMFCICNTTWGELMYRLKDYCEGNGQGPLFKG